MSCCLTVGVAQVLLGHSEFSIAHYKYADHPCRDHFLQRQDVIGHRMDYIQPLHGLLVRSIKDYFHATAFVLGQKM